jgi:hypothetical protein
MELIGSHATIEAICTIHLAEGEDNLVQWRAEDVAGTGLTESMHYVVRIDMRQPTFDDLLPREPQSARTFTVEAFLDDEGGSGLDPDSVEWSTDGSNWTRVDDISGNLVSASVTVPMDGIIKITLRVKDNAGNMGISGPLEVLVDTTPPYFGPSEPPSGTYLTGTERSELG